MIGEHHKLRNAKGYEMEGKDKTSKKVRLWNWKITAMLHKTEGITLWQLDVGNDAIMNNINLLIR